MKKVVFIVCAVFSTTFSSFFDSGRNEIGGGLSFAYYSYTSHGKMFLEISPYYSYYGTKNLSFGPIFSISMESPIRYDVEKDFGMRIGLGGPINNSYLYIAPGFALAFAGGSTARALPVTTGAKILLTKHLGIDIHADYAAVFFDWSERPCSIGGAAIGLFGLL
jgi:hypothetical protein